jgi:hypothetical protein
VGTTERIEALFVTLYQDVFKRTVEKTSVSDEV